MLCLWPYHSAPDEAKQVCVYWWKAGVHVWKHSDTSGLWQAEMECSGQIVEFSAHSTERERKQSMLLFMSTQSVESFACSSYQAALHGTVGHCFLLRKWVLGNLVRWLMWPATAMGTVPVDMLDCLLWPCRQVLGPGGMSPSRIVVGPKPDQSDCLLWACTGLLV